MIRKIFVGISVSETVKKVRAKNGITQKVAGFVVVSGYVAYHTGISGAYRR